MALEIVASRVIAPYFGNSVYVWGSLIGVFLAALSVGYFLGGRIADRWPSPAVFAGVVFVAGALVFPIPLVVPRLLESIALADLGPRGNPLVGALVLFFLPSIVMGMVSPFAIRLRARAVATIGNVAGVLYALSTVGSIAGTLLAAFVLLAVMNVRTIVHLLGGVLMVLALLGWLTDRRRGVAAAGLVVAVLLGAGVPLAGSADAPEGLRYEQDTVYHRITVNDEGTTRYLKLDNYWQTGLDLTNPRRTVFAYADYLHLPVVFRPDARRVLLIGLGGGTVPTRYHQDYARITTEVVELDPAVIAVARRYFRVPEGERLHVVAQDGRLFLARTPNQYDIILLDAYLIDTIPFHLATQEFFQTAKAHLAPGGVLASNVIGALGGPQSRFFRAVYKTFRTVFPTVYVFPVDWYPFGSVESMRNIILIGTDQPALRLEAINQAAAKAREIPGVTVDRFASAIRSLYTELIPTHDVPVLTDDFAPVELLVQRR